MLQKLLILLFIIGGCFAMESIDSIDPTEPKLSNVISAVESPSKSKEFHGFEIPEDKPKSNSECSMALDQIPVGLSSKNNFVSEALSSSQNLNSEIVLNQQEEIVRRKPRHEMNYIQRQVLDAKWFFEGMSYSIRWMIKNEPVASCFFAYWIALYTIFFFMHFYRHLST
ncbi:hypothetical protein PGT21_017651 [Puccinia graminis f. sp. tritici]|uniref:Uncharacterized protein n=1 Tax=Puccinia graminis f. sp. tritici TaxID=56615 RepID=A0A5B0PP38_PUCGR|nr:hypothetical protein PGT21_017651 [Puccinia graminis f. sp. tritici]